MHRFFLVCFFFSFSLFAQDIVMRDGVLFTEQITAILPEIIMPKKIIISSQGYVDQDEIRYLCKLQEHRSVSQEDMITGLSYCMKKQQFDSITLTWDENQAVLHLHFVLAYRIKKIHFGGISYGIETYKRLYGAETYELFDTKKHTQGLQTIVVYMHSIGYWDAHIQDVVEYDEKKRYTTIFLQLHFGSCYTITDCNLILDHVLLHHQKKISSLFTKWVKHVLEGKKYNHTNLNGTLSHYISQLYLAGFLCENLQMKEKIDTHTKTVSLEFTLKHNYPYRIVFKGNTFFSHNMLYQQIETIFHDERMIASSSIGQTLVERYKKEGFLDVHVIQSTHNAESIFMIQEGNRFSLKDVHVSFLDEKNEIYTAFCTFLAKRLSGHIASREYIEKTIGENLLQMKDAGFLDATLVQYSIEQKTHHSADLYIHIDPKKQSIITTIELQSTIPLDELPSFSLTGVCILTPFMLTEQKKTIETCLQKHGYLHATIFPEILPETLIWHIHPGKQTTSGTIVIKGNPAVSFSRMSTLINIPTQTYWKQTNLQEPIQILQKLGMYKRVELYPDTTDNTLCPPVIMHLIPDNPCELRLRLGGELQHMQDYQSFDGISYKAGCSFIVKNIAHLADKLQCDVDFAKTHREIVASWSVPFAVHKKNVLPLSALWHVKTQGYHMRFDNPGAIGYQKNIYTIARDGFLVSIVNTKDNSYFNINLGFEQQKTSITDQKNAIELARALNFDPQELSKPVPYTLLDVNFLFDFLDHAIYPTRGVLSVCGIKTMIPIHDFSTYYVKFMFQQIFFFSCFDFIFGLRARFGYLFHKDFSKINPAERFYLGGSHSVRGYEADYFPPISPFIDSSGRETIVPRGGKIMANVNIEMNRKIWSFVSIALFHDIGALADDIETMTAMIPLHASGCGIRFETPFGPLRFDIGWKWKKIRLEERNYAWYISFGRSF